MIEGGEQPVVRAYVVHGRVGAQTFVYVADVSVGERQELVLAGEDGGCIAIFAPGQWFWVEVAEMVEEGA